MQTLGGWVRVAGMRGGDVFKFAKHTQTSSRDHLRNRQEQSPNISSRQYTSFLFSPPPWRSVFSFLEPLVWFAKKRHTILATSDFLMLLLFVLAKSTQSVEIGVKLRNFSFLHKAHNTAGYIMGWGAILFYCNEDRKVVWTTNTIKWGYASYMIFFDFIPPAQLPSRLGLKFQYLFFCLSQGKQCILRFEHPKTFVYVFFSEAYCGFFSRGLRRSPKVPTIIFFANPQCKEYFVEWFV